MKKLYMLCSGTFVAASDSLAEIKRIKDELSSESETAKNKISDIYMFPDTIDIENNNEALSDYFQREFGDFNVCRKKKNYNIPS